MRARLRLGLALLLGLALPVAAQETPRGSFLLLNQERLLSDSAPGKALLAGEEQERDALRKDARAIDLAFETEERKLTEQRATVSAEEFRALADSFDARVVQARRDQDARSSALAQEFDQRRRQFYAQVGPILVAVMARFGAQAIFDENSVLLADQTLNVTDAVIAEIDAKYHDGDAAVGPAAEPDGPAIKSGD